MPDPRPPLPPDLGDLRPGSLTGQLADDAYICDLVVQGDDVGGLSCDLAEVSGCRVTMTRFAGSSWRKPEWVNLVLNTCDLANVAFTEASWRRVDLAGCRLTGLQVPAATWQDVSIRGSSGELVNLRQSRLQRVVFDECHLSGIDFGEAQLSDVSFRGCDLSGVQFTGTRLTRVRFDDCVLDGLGGITQLGGVTIAGGDPVMLAHTMATALGIRLLP